MNISVGTYDFCAFSPVGMYSLEDEACERRRIQSRLHIKGADDCWYTTVLIFWVGMVFAEFKEPIEKAFQRDNERYGLLLFFSAVIMLIIWVTLPLTKYEFNMYQLKSLMFLAVILLFSMKVKIGNRILAFLGKYTFEIYILQRLPLRFAKQYISTNMYVIFAFGFAVTIILSVIFGTLLRKLDKQWFKLTDRFLSPKKSSAA